MRIIMGGGILFVLTATLATVLNQTVGYLISPSVVLASIPVGLILGFFAKKWYKTPQWIKNQMVDPGDD